MELINKNIILGVCGSIAAYKSPDIVRRLKDFGADVKVVLTSSGAKFVSKLSLETVSQNPVYSELWDSEMEHINLAKWADIVLIAPITANTIATITFGNATNLLGNIILATNAKLIIAPAMNKEMLLNSAVKENLSVLKQRGVQIIKSESGVQACGDVGVGRLPEPIQIAEFVAQSFYSKLAGKKVVITLGATIEKIDAVRYISNFSSGKMGLALINACLNQGLSVVAIYGNISVDLPQKSKNIQALSGDEMFEVAQEQTKNADIFISCAAVSDYKVQNIANKKIKKTDNLTLDLVKNIDILKEIASKKDKLFCVGFAAETDNLLEYAKQKLADKNLDMIIANDVKNGFGGDENEVYIIDEKQQKKLKKAKKSQISEQIVSFIAKKL
jgi:phosphopantothenoylcysteine decarboxylase/phosphopantothenate--cysteine ligase